MYKLILVFAVLTLSAGTSAFADNSDQVITLKDGSQIVGQLVGINNGVYTIKAPIIGNVQASASDVVSITNHHDNPGNPGQGYPGNPQPIGPSFPNQPNQPNQPPGYIPDLNQRIAEEQRDLMANPESMAILMQMAQDPEIVRLLQDPELVEAVEHHDLRAVESNPRIKELINNPHVQEFLRRLEALQGHDHDHDHDHDHPTYP